jgi:hypothetical protein
MQFCEHKFLFFRNEINTFEPVIGSRVTGIKREVRCKSGAIPVAVSASACMITVVEPAFSKPLFRKAEWEGALPEPEDLPIKISLIKGFRVKSRR